MTPRFVHRDGDGNLLGHYANPQPGYAEEEVADDHPDIVAWQEARAEAEKPKLMAADILSALLVSKGLVTQDELDVAIEAGKGVSSVMCRPGET